MGPGLKLASSLPGWRSHPALCTCLVPRSLPGAAALLHWPPRDDNNRAGLFEGAGFRSGRPQKPLHPRTPTNLQLASAVPLLRLLGAHVTPAKPGGPRAPRPQHTATTKTRRPQPSLSTLRNPSAPRLVSIFAAALPRWLVKLRTNFGAFVASTFLSPSGRLGASPASAVFPLPLPNLGLFSSSGAKLPLARWRRRQRLLHIVVCALNFVYCLGSWPSLLWRAPNPHQRACYSCICAFLTACESRRSVPFAARSLWPRPSCTPC